MTPSPSVERNPALIVDARHSHVASLDFQNVVLAVAVLIDPSADRIAGKEGFLILRPGASIGVDAARLRRHDLGQNKCGVRRDDELNWKEGIHLPRYAHRDASCAGAIEALSALRLVRQAGFVNKPILLYERRLLSPPVRLAVVISRRAAFNPPPLAGPVGYLGSSCAQARGAVITSAAASTVAATEIRYNMNVLP